MEIHEYWLAFLLLYSDFWCEMALTHAVFLSCDLEHWPPEAPSVLVSPPVSCSILHEPFFLL